MQAAQDITYTQYNPESPTPQAVAQALNHLPVVRALDMIDRAAITTGGWSRQLLELRMLLSGRARQQ